MIDIRLDYAKIGSNIRKYRKEKKITQNELAKKIFKSEISVRKYEKGNINIPNGVLLQISSALDVPIYKLMDIEPDDSTLKEAAEALGVSANFLLGIPEDSSLINQTSHTDWVQSTVDEYKEVYKRVLNIYGEKNQVVVAIEELSELQKELCKHLRGITKKPEIADEIADVEIMLEQMELLFNIEKEVKERKQFKVERLTARLDQKQNHNEFKEGEK